MKNNNSNMSVLQPVIDDIQRLVLGLPQNWADVAAVKMGSNAAVVRYYARGQRGKRNFDKILELHGVLKEMAAELQCRVETALS
jgi:hypothetical protein